MLRLQVSSEFEKTLHTGQSRVSLEGVGLKGGLEALAVIKAPIVTTVFNT